MSTTIIIKNKISPDLKLLINNTIIAENEENNPTLTSYYEKCINQAIVDGWPQHTISQKLLKELDKKLFHYKHNTTPNITIEECKINRSLWHRTTRRLNCSDPKFKTNELDKAPHVEPDNSSKVTPENNINYDAHHILSHLVTVIQNIQKKIKTSPNLSFEIFDKPQRDNFYKELTTVMINIDHTYNEKLKVPENTEHLFVNIFCHTNILLSEGGTKFATQKLKMLATQRKNLITLKQINKFTNNESSSTLQLFHSHTLDQALFDGFTGAQCEKCNSWKTREETNNKHKIYCEDCRHIMTGKTIPRCNNCKLLFHKETIKKIIENHNKCPQCHENILLYEELRMWALS